MIAEARVAPGDVLVWGTDRDPRERVPTLVLRVEGGRTALALPRGNDLAPGVVLDDADLAHLLAVGEVQVVRRDPPPARFPVCLN